MALVESLMAKLHEATRLKMAALGLKNAQRNLPLQKYTVGDIQPDYRPNALVICAGPSLHRNGHLKKIAKSAYEGEIVATDGALPACLRNGLVPDFVVTLDSHPTRIVRWFGDPDLETRPDDHYFRHQELDPEFARNERKLNRELIELVDHGSHYINLVIASCVDQSVALRTIQAGMNLYWWNPIYDDPTHEDSITREVHRLNGALCMATGGNCGTAAWVFAHSILRKKEVAIVGMDFGYAPGTSIENTQYYDHMKELLGDRVAEGYPQVGDGGWFTDPTYMWYRDEFLEMVRRAPCRTVNCTEGGIVRGEGIEEMRLDEWLRSF